MCIGFGIGDILAVFDLADKVRQNLVDAPGEYESVRH
jgi:hypothetical protein